MCRAYLSWACLVLFANGRRLQEAGIEEKALGFDTNSLARLLIAMQRPASSMRQSPLSRSSLLRMRGGADEDLKAAIDCNELMSSVLAEVALEVSSLRGDLSDGKPLSNFGSKADMIVNGALEKFDSETPEGGSAKTRKLYEAKRSELEISIQNSLSPVFVQQICILKGIALETFLKGLSGDSDGGNAMISAENAFVREATASVPTSQRWSFRTDRDNLVRSMQAILNERNKANDAKLKSSQDMQTAMTYLQMQQQQMRELQAAYLGGQANKWSVGAAYRPEDTDINLSTNYQNGRCNVQVRMVPDEGANLLGSNGFVKGVGPADLGLSFNIHM